MIQNVRSVSLESLSFVLKELYSYNCMNYNMFVKQNKNLLNFYPFAKKYMKKL